MRKIKIIEHMSLDGVIQAPGGPEEDGDYPYGGWAAPYDDDEGGAAILAAHSPGFDLLLGRRTYDIWAGFWPKIRGNPMGDGLNAATKYVATHRPESLEWGPAEGLGPDLLADVRRIKASGGGDLVLWGSSTLTPVLLEHGLADEILLIVYPVLLGEGKRLFSNGALPRELTLTGSKAASCGIIVNTYKPAGPLRTGSFAEADGHVIQPRSSDETVIEQAYAAFNERNIDGALALMTEDVSWPRASEGGTVIGKEEIRAYWTRQWGEFDPHVEPLAMTGEEGGKIRVRVHQLVKSLQADVLSDSEVMHRFTVKSGLIAAMNLGDLDDEAGTPAGPSAAFAHRP